jgi:hypothetical protein
MPDWVPDLWSRGDSYRRLLGVLESLEPQEARALLVFPPDHEEAYRPGQPSREDSQ